MEAIVSLLILSILLSTIVAIIRFSTVITATSLSNATEAQNTVNSLALEQYASEETPLLTFSFVSTTGESVTATHNIYLSSEDTIIAFRPAGGDTP